MKDTQEFFTLGYSKPTMFDVQNYLDHLGTRLMSVRDIIKYIEKHFKTIKNLKLDRFGKKVLSFEEFQKEEVEKDMALLELVEDMCDLRRSDLGSTAMKSAWDKKCGGGDKKKSSKKNTNISKIARKVGAGPTYNEFDPSENEARFRNPRDYKDLGIGNVKYKQKKGEKRKTKKSSKTYEQFIKETHGSTAVFTFGRFNPPTIGHEKLIKVVANTATKEGGDYFVYMSHSQDAKKNPLNYAQKMMFMKLMFPTHRSNIAKSNARTALEVAVELYDKGHYSKLVMIVGSDRVKEFNKILNQYNGVDKRHGFYDFKQIEVISAGERDPDADGAEGISASKMRAAVAAGDYDYFKMGVPTGVSEKDCHNLYNAVAKGMKMKLKEEWDGEEEMQEVLDPAQRRKMALRMKIQAKKPAFLMKRQRAMKKAATKQQLHQRSHKAAIAAVVKKFFPKLKTKKTSDLSYSERGKISDIVKKKAKVIARVAKRLVKDKRKQDVERRKSAGKSKEK